MRFTQFLREDAAHWPPADRARAERLFRIAQSRQETPTDLVHATLQRSGPVPEPALLVASELAAMSGEHGPESLLCAGIAVGLADAGRNEDAQHGWWQVWEAAVSIADFRVQARALAEIARLNLRTGRLREAANALRRALTLLEGAGLDADEGCALHDLAMLQLEHAALASAHLNMKLSLQLIERAGTTRMVMRVRQGLGNVLRELGKPGDAEAHFVEAMAIARANDWAHEEAALLVDLGRNFHALGMHVEAQECATRAISITQDAKHLPCRADAYELLALVAEFQGLLPEALEYCECGLTYARRSGARAKEAALLALAARIHMLRGDLSRACEVSARMPHFPADARVALLHTKPLAVRLAIEAAAAFGVAAGQEGAWRLDNLERARSIAAGLTSSARVARRKGDRVPGLIARRCNLLVLELEDAVATGRDPRIIGGHLPEELSEGMSNTLRNHFEARSVDGKPDSRRYTRLQLLVRRGAGPQGGAP